MDRSAYHAAALIAAGAIAWAPGHAHAADSTTNAPPGYSLSPTGPTPVTVTREYQTPNESFVSSGAFLFGTTYAASAIVAATSDRAADKRLFIPVAGPWLDLGHRASCPDHVCPGETANKVLLVANGLLQGVGTLHIITGFLFPTKYIETEHQPVARGVHFSPTAGIGTVGLTAYGVF